MQASMAMLNTLLTNDADANAGVEYRPTIILSAKATIIIPNCPTRIGNPSFMSLG